MLKATFECDQSSNREGQSAMPNRCAVGPATTPMRLPDVSIVMPVLNEARFIEKCLQTIVSQDYPPEHLEILVLDGGSTDGTQEKIREFAKSHPRLRLAHNAQRTQAKGFNLGVRQSTGEVIIRMDAHAEYDPSYIRNCIQVLAETGAANVGGIWITRPGRNTLMGKSVAVACQLRFGLGGARGRIGGGPRFVDTVPFGAYPREVFDKVGLLNEALDRGEDNEFNARVRSAGLAIYYDPRIVSVYYARPTLGSFLDQLYRNGLYHAPTLKANIKGCSIRHLVPFAFLMALLVCALVGPLWVPAWRLGLLILAAYLVANIVASIDGARRHGWKYLGMLPWMFPLMHLTYGIATLAGILSLPLFGRRRRL
jgi:succinoglycan biosynthesis protein ExoA